MLRLVVRVAAAAVALWVATRLVDGVRVGGEPGREQWLTLLGAAVIFGLVNAVVKPVVKLLSLPFILLTLGLLLLVINALMLLLTAAIADGLDLAFDVDGFGAAFFGGIVVSVVMWAVDVLLPERLERR